MFSNYTTGTQVTNKDKCGCHDHTTPTISHNTPVLTQKDDYGNIIKLQWTPNARFTLNLTSDTWTPIFDGSKVLEKPGATPEGIAGYINMYAYNLSDYKCWQYNGAEWVEQPDIESSPRSNTVVLFSMENSSTRISIKNFRGEPVYTVENDSNVVSVSIDDTLAQILLQSYYNIDVYQITKTSTRHVRRIPVSIGYNLQRPDAPPIINNVPQGNGCHSVAGFATDNTLEFRNNILSVNVKENCEYGNTLPVSSGAVFEYSQPRNLVVEINTDTMTSPYTSKDIYSFVIVQGGDAFCYYNGLYIPYVEGDDELVKFSSLLMQEAGLKTFILEIDDCGNVNDKSTLYDPSAGTDYSSLRADLTTLREMHIVDAKDADRRLDAIEGNLKETSIPSLVSAIERLEDDMDTKATTSSVTEVVAMVSNLDVALSTKASHSEVQALIRDALDAETVFDGGVIT
jgi:hypothetical protein